MNFIETLKFKNKLVFLFLSITIGLFSMGIIGAININIMKRNLDYLYFGSFIPVIELNKILELYHGELTNGIYKAKNSTINKDEFRFIIEDALSQINKNWSSYKSHYKKDDELNYIGYVDEEILKSESYFKELVQYTQNGYDIKKISLRVLEKQIAHIHLTIKKLIKYEIDVAKYERKSFLMTHKSTTLQLSIILSILILTLLFISYLVFKSIQSSHSKLLITTKKLKKVNKKLESVSYTDTLTSLHNRRYFNFIYDKEIKRAKRSRSYITFMMLDIDYFKQYNDTYGHLEGDKALKIVADVLKESLKRPSDFVFRLGGEEFGVILSATDEKNSIKIAQDINKNLKTQKIEHKNSLANQFMTISIGIVCCIADDTLDEERILSRADEMLYEAKDDGRDCFKLTTSLT